MTIFPLRMARCMTTPSYSAVKTLSSRWTRSPRLRVRCVICGRVMFMMSPLGTVKRIERRWRNIICRDWVRVRPPHHLLYAVCTSVPCYLLNIRPGRLADEPISDCVCWPLYMRKMRFLIMNILSDRRLSHCCWSREHICQAVAREAEESDRLIM